MHTTNLRKVGGSVMLSVPPAILEMLHLQVGSTVSVQVDGESLIIKGHDKPKYTMAELLATSDYSQSTPSDDAEWTNGAAVGGELI